MKKDLRLDTAFEDAVQNEAKNAAAIEDMSPEAVQAELNRNALLLSRLELQEKAASLIDLKERIAERGLKRESRESVYRGHGQNLAQDRRNKNIQQERCNHHKGGDGAKGIIGGEGHDVQYAVLKHRMANGDMWVRCLRCAKTWKPPVKSMYETREAYLVAKSEYELAAKFSTRNQTSSSKMFGWGHSEQGESAGIKWEPNAIMGGEEFYREKMKSVTLE